MTMEQIRQSADIVREMISAKQYASLVGLPINRNGFTRCPFHSGDNTGSLKLYDGRRGWHCFGCGADGDVVELAKRYYGLNFPQAIAKVARDAGIALPGTGEMTYDQARAYQAAQSRRAELINQERIERAADDKFFEAFDDLLEIESKMNELDELITLFRKYDMIPDDEIMDEFFALFAAKIAVNKALPELDSRRIHA